MRFLFFILLQGSCLFSSATAFDSLKFIEKVKQFAFKEIGVHLKGDFYTKSMEMDKPYVYLYVSLPDKIKTPPGYSDLYFCNTDEMFAGRKSDSLKLKGYQTFCYKTYANSSAMLNKRFLSYPLEAESFIIFHELIHNYLSQQEIKIPYDFNEALCDVIGNYGTLDFFKTNKQLDLNAAKQQLEHNENIYWCLNKYISKINEKPGKVIVLNNQCDRMMKTILKECNTFQNDRFNFTVNNAYLLKNQYYCKNYFLLKKVLMKQKSIKDFLEIIKAVPANSEECEKYLLKFS